MSDLTAEQFQLSVAAAIEGVENLYRQVDLLIAKLREQLAEDPDPLKLIRGTLGKSGKEDSKRVVVRYEYGALFEPATDDEEGLDDEDDEDDDSEDEDADDAVDSSRRGSARAGVTRSWRDNRCWLFGSGCSIRESERASRQKCSLP